jgi:hypothetical protein
VEQEGSTDVAAFIPVMDRMEVPQEGMSGDG